MRDFSERAAAVRARWRELMHSPLITADNKHEGLVCPDCENGTGDDGTGLREIPNSNGALHCFKCGKTFDVIDVIEQTKKCTRTEALAKAESALGITPGSSSYGQTASRQRPAKAPQTRDDPKDKPDYRPYLERARKALTDDSAGAAYLQERHISLETARELGIGYDTVTNRIIVPTGNGGYQARYAGTDIPNGQLKVRNAKDYPVGLSFCACLHEPAPVTIVEGPIDAASVYEAGGQAVSLNGVGNIGRLIERLEELLEVPPLILALDADEPGQNAQRTLAAALEQHNIHFIPGTIILKDCKDPNESHVLDAPLFRKRVAQDILRANPVTDVALSYAGTDTLKADFTTYLARTCDGTEYIPTGIAPLDDALGGGLYAGLYVLGGRTGAGKSSLALQIADSIAAQGRPVLYVALEMSADELRTKSLARIAQADTGKGVDAMSSADAMRRGTGKLIGTDAFARYVSDVVPHLKIHEAIGHTPASAVADYATKMAIAQDKAPIVIVDYLQIMGTDDPRQTDKQAADTNVLGLKQLSRDLNTPVIAISSMNRASYSDDGKPMSEAAFKESGGIEYTADVLLGLERTGNEPAEVIPKAVQITVLKNRRGKRDARCGFNFYGHTGLFVPYDGAVRDSQTIQPGELRMPHRAKRNTCR